MSLITQNDREYILGQLRTAPDSILAEAMLKLNAMREDFITVRALCQGQGEKLVEQPVAPVEVKERPNVKPGVATTTRVGGETEKTIMEDLSQGRQPSAKYAEALKLLWERGKVKFDGKEYYL